ncbi:hypothetical protein VTJ49DRAFT_3450 [Mycothermus thermophilus]|uniref:Uncharacterized protein n=1 Tax=Humicola insolens TaxID=85995 RepID=A0ABR3V7H0_HUMIN
MSSPDAESTKSLPDAEPNLSSPYRNKERKLICVIAPPVAGKTTLARRLVQEYKSVHVCVDELLRGMPMRERERASGGGDSTTMGL